MASRRQRGRGLLAFGLVGLAILVAAGGVVLATFGTLSQTAADLGRQRDQLARMVAPAGVSLRSAATAARNASASLEQSAVAARDGSALMTQLALSLDQLAGLSSISFLGQQPFQQATASFQDTAARSRTLAGNLATTATALETNTDDATTVATDLDSLAGQLDALQAELATSQPTPPSWAWGALAGLVLAILLWLGVAAAVCVRIGAEWARL